ncbi:secreted RxLR effector protein 161-like [Miscanthus floridulus]|uniref:secreted RxLR effector protein 161-like n=1 Tax=Miscanthus floridulus TaxID=154761 RepID=UPI00345AD2CB
MEPHLKLSKKSTAPAVDTTAYRSIIGSLWYLVNTRPDLAYSVGYVSRFMEKPTTEHLANVKRVLRYIAGTLDYGCYYTRKEKDVHLVEFRNSDHARDIDSRRSFFGVLYFLGKNVITWYSQKQKVMALSTCEAKYIAGTTAACQGVWLTCLLAELKGKKEGTVKIHIDS